jgi:hypothetical protein
MYVYFIKKKKQLFSHQNILLHMNQVMNEQEILSHIVLSTIFFQILLESIIK